MTDVLQRFSPTIRGLIAGTWKRICSHRPPHRLRLCETLQLGERRFLAVVEFEQDRFLIGGTPNSLVLLSALHKRQRDNGEQESLATEAQPALARSRPC